MAEMPALRSLLFRLSVTLLMLRKETSVVLRTISDTYRISTLYALQNCSLLHRPFVHLSIHPSIYNRGVDA